MFCACLHKKRSGHFLYLICMYSNFIKRIDSLECRIFTDFPLYGWIFSKSRDFLKKRLWANALLAGFFSFLTGQLVDLPFLLFSKTVTILYLVMGLKTSLIQGCLKFIVTLFLWEPVTHVLKRIQHERIK